MCIDLGSMYIHIWVLTLDKPNFTVHCTMCFHSECCRWFNVQCVSIVYSLFCGSNHIGWMGNGDVWCFASEIWKVKNNLVKWKSWLVMCTCVCIVCVGMINHSEFIMYRNKGRRYTRVGVCVFFVFPLFVVCALLVLCLGFCCHSTFYIVDRTMDR